MNISFNTNIANALIGGHPLPVDFVHSFVNEAYQTFQYAQEAQSRINQLESRLVEMKVSLIDTQKELEESKENARIAQEQRNASNRKIEELQDELYKLKEEQDNKN